MSEDLDKHEMKPEPTPAQPDFIRWIPGIIRHDFWRKFCAVAFAAVVTVVVYNSRLPEASDQVETVYLKPVLHLPAKNNDGEYRWLNRGENIEVGVRLTGDSRTIAELTQNLFGLEHQITDEEIGRKEIVFSEKDLRFGDQTQFVHKKLDLKKIKFTIAGNKKLPIVVDQTGIGKQDIRTEDKNVLSCYRIVSKPITIKVNYKKEDLPEGYYLEGNPSIYMLTGEPSIFKPTDKAPDKAADKPVKPPTIDTITVSGPESFFRNQNISVTTKLIPLKDQVATFTTLAELIPPEPGLELAYRRLPVCFNISRLKKDGPKICPVSILISPEKSQQFYAVLKSAPVVSLMVEGERKSMDTLSINELHPFINLNGLTSVGVYKVKVGCVVDVPGVKVYQITPSEAEVELIQRTPEK